MSTVIRTIASTCMGGAEGNTGQRHTPLITLASCVRGIAQHRPTGVTTLDYGVETHHSVEASAYRHGLGVTSRVTLGQPMPKPNLWRIENE